MKNFIQNLKRLVYFLPYVFVFIASLYRPKDPDLGWHLRYGEYFFKHHQILRDNIFSTMMLNFHWANGSWGTDLITYFIYNHWGFLGLTLVSALIVTLTFFFFSKAAKFTFFENSLFFPVLVYLESSVNSSSFRGQQLSLLFLGLLFFILSRYKSFSKILFLIPILFLIWCNVHEEVFLGLALLALWTGLIIVKNHFEDFKESVFLIIVFILSFLVTFINPFGSGIHQDALSHLESPILYKVNEYVPFFAYSKSWWNLIVTALFLTAGIIYIFFKKNALKTLPAWTIPLILLILTFFIRRYVWPAYYLTLPIFCLLIQIIKPFLKKLTLFVGVILSLISILYAINLKMPFSQFSNMSWETYCVIQGMPCSLQSAKYLIKHNLTQSLYSYYDWGGWLIWNYPQIKPSIDGRMHLWKDNKGYGASLKYYDYWMALKSIDKSTYNVVYLPQDRSPIYMELSSLVKQNKWKSVYQDDFSIIVVRAKINL
jgi:hypothetical protein